MRTQTKIMLARLAYYVVMTARKLVGKGNHVQVQRNGFAWDLDLTEGIDFSIYLLGTFEPATSRALNQLIGPGDTVLDIGANMGAHTLQMARAAGSTGRVIAFEPTNFAFRKLQRHLQLNPVFAARITPEQIMLTAGSHDPTAAQLYSSWPLAGGDHLHGKHGGQLMETQGASARSLDDYLQDKKVTRVNVIKLDVDGHEYSVLKGGAKMLRASRPRILMEISPYIHAEENTSFEDLLQLLNNLGYRYRLLRSRTLQNFHAAELRRRIPDGGRMNVILEA